MKKLLSTLGGILFREAPSNKSPTDTFQWTCEVRTFSVGITTGQAATGRGEGIGCGLGLKYALIVAAIVSEVEIINNCRRTSILKSCTKHESGAILSK